LLSSLLVKFLTYFFRIMQHRDIFISNFKTQLAIICALCFINCFPFLIPNEMTKISSNVNHRIYLLFLGARVTQWVRSLDLTAHTSLSPIRRGFMPNFVNNKKGCTRLAAASDKVCQLLAQGRWFSLGTPASSITKTGRHD
jgi:hypothetical protein